MVGLGVRGGEVYHYFSWTKAFTRSRGEKKEESVSLEEKKGPLPGPLLQGIPEARAKRGRRERPGFKVQEKEA